VHEEDLANLQRRIDEVLAGEVDPGRRRRPAHDLGEIEEALARREVVRPEDELALEVLDLIEREAVGVLARLQVGEARDAALLLLGLLLRSSLWHSFLKCERRKVATSAAQWARSAGPELEVPDVVRHSIKGEAELHSMSLAQSTHMVEAHASIASSCRAAATRCGCGRVTRLRLQLRRKWNGPVIDSRRLAASH